MESSQFIAVGPPGEKHGASFSLGMLFVGVIVLSMVIGLPGAEASTKAKDTAAPSLLSPDEGRNCLGQGRTRFAMNHVLGIAYGPLGVEHTLRMGVCTPVSRKPGVLFRHSFFEVGYQQRLSPIYLMPGAYMSFAPLSFLIFDVVASPVAYWPLDLRGAAYHELSGYQADYRPDALPPEQGRSAVGWYLHGGVTLQLSIPLGPVNLLVLDILSFERWVLGTADYYYHNRQDLPAANPEGFLDNNALVMLELPVHPNVQVRFGVNDQLTMNFGAQQKSNTLAAVTMVNFNRLGTRIRDFGPLVRVGGRTHHPVRQGEFTFIVAVRFSVDLSKQVPELTRAGGPQEATPAEL